MFAYTPPGENGLVASERTRPAHVHFRKAVVEGIPVYGRECPLSATRDCAPPAGRLRRGLLGPAGSPISVLQTRERILSRLLFCEVHLLFPTRVVELKGRQYVLIRLCRDP